MGGAWRVVSVCRPFILIHDVSPIASTRVHVSRATQTQPTTRSEHPSRNQAGATNNSHKRKVCEASHPNTFRQPVRPLQTHSDKLNEPPEDTTGMRDESPSHNHAIETGHPHTIKQVGRPVQTQSGKRDEPPTHQSGKRDEPPKHHQASEANRPNNNTARETNHPNTIRQTQSHGHVRIWGECAGELHSPRSRDGGRRGRRGTHPRG